MGRYKNILALFTLSVMIMSLSIVASAQWRNSRSNNDYYGNGRNTQNLNSTINSLESKSRRFEDILDRELDRSSYDGSRTEDRLNDLAEKFKDATENLADEYDNPRDYNKSADEVRKVLNYGSQLNSALNGMRANRNSTLRNSWSSIQRDLRTLSNAYNTSYNNDSYNSRRNGDKNKNRNRNRNRNRQDNSRIYNSRVTTAINNLRSQSYQFESRINNNRRSSRRDNRTRYSSNLDSLSNRFNDTVVDLSNKHRRKRFTNTYSEAQKVIRLGERIDKELSRTQTNRRLSREWRSMERNLRTIAQAYNIRYRGNNRSNSRNRSTFGF